MAKRLRLNGNETSLITKVWSRGLTRIHLSTSLI